MTTQIKKSLWGMQQSCSVTYIFIEKGGGDEWSQSHEYNSHVVLPLLHTNIRRLLQEERMRMPLVSGII